MILTLITLGKLLELVAKGKTTSAVRRLIDLTPKTVTVIKDGEEIEIQAKDLMIGDVLIVKRGENVAADGVIVDGELSVDESSLSGEPIPRDRNVGDEVYGGTTAVFGYAKIRAEKVGETTVIAGIIRMVKEASGSKAPIARAADKVAAVFVPAVLGIALITFIVWMLIGSGVGEALTHAVAVLVISCPCALGLATPVAVMVGTGVGARHGILFKNAEALELSGKIKTVCFDKTGTLTEGAPTLAETVTYGVEKQKTIALCAALERLNEHPLARAVVKYAEAEKIASYEAENYSACTRRWAQEVGLSPKGRPSPLARLSHAR
jgi:P-type E1-E2 ATPase